MEDLSTHFPPKNILCPIDFSEFSDRAFHYAACIARHFRAELILQHVVHIPLSTFFGAAEPIVADSNKEAASREARIHLRRLAAVTRLQHSQIEMIVSDGSIRDELLKTIEANKIDLLVMGTHGRKGFNRLVLGSVAETLGREADCPVLSICRPQKDFIAPEEPHPCHLKRIVMATDFSADSSRALSCALRWACEWSAELILFHAVEQQPAESQGRVDLFPEYNRYFEKQIVEGWEAIQKQLPPNAVHNAKISYEVRHGSSKEAIADFATEANADVIIIGNRGPRSGGQVWGSTLSSILSDGRFPVLTIPANHDGQKSREA